MSLCVKVRLWEKLGPFNDRSPYRVKWRFPLILTEKVYRVDHSTVEPAQFCIGRKDLVFRDGVARHTNDIKKFCMRFPDELD